VRELYPLGKLKLNKLFPILETMNCKKKKINSKDLADILTQDNTIKKDNMLDMIKNVAAEQNEIKREVLIKDKTIKKIKVMDKRLDDVFEYYSKKYEGTNPIEDAKIIHAEDKMKERGVIKNPGQDVYHKVDKQQRPDPFDIFGHGIKSYFKMMEVLGLVMVIISILFIPVFTLYSHGDAYPEDQTLARLSLGNIGHAENYCMHQFTSVKEPQHLNCQKGKLSEIKFAGVMPNDILKTGDVEPPFLYDYCSNNKIHTEIEKCS